MSVAGTWRITIKGPLGITEVTTLVLEDGNGKLTGTQTGRGSTTSVTDASFDGSKISWINNVTQPMKIKVKFSGVVDGDTMNGKVKAGIAGSFPFTGVRT